MDDTFDELIFFGFALIVPAVIKVVTPAVSRLKVNIWHERSRRMAALSSALRLQMAPTRPGRQLLLEGVRNGTRVRVTALPSGEFEVAALTSRTLPQRASSRTAVQLDGNEVFQYLPPQATEADFRTALNAVVQTARRLAPDEDPAEPSSTHDESSARTSPGLRRWILRNAVARHRRAIIGAALFFLLFLGVALTAALQIRHSTRLALLAFAVGGLYATGGVWALFDTCPACRKPLQGTPLYLPPECLECGVRLR